MLGATDTGSGGEGRARYKIGPRQFDGLVQGQRPPGPSRKRFSSILRFVGLFFFLLVCLFFT